ncbi:MAG: hypothetical protein H0U03_12175, partial [Actinobacteria bacterium]|nr:hypothetical protein [Actinomycetota bacterium]
MKTRRTLSGLALAALLLAAAAAAAGPRVTAVVRTGNAPCGAVAAFGALWVANYRSGTVVRIDPRRNR